MPIVARIAPRGELLAVADPDHVLAVDAPLAHLHTRDVVTDEPARTRRHGRETALEFRYSSCLPTGYRKRIDDIRIRCFTAAGVEVREFGTVLLGHRRLKLSRFAGPSRLNIGRFHLASLEYLDVSVFLGAPTTATRVVVEIRGPLIRPIN